MFDLIKKYKGRIAIGLAFFAALIVYSLDLRHMERANFVERTILRVFAPMQRITAQGGMFVSSLWSDYLFLVNVREENKYLRETVKNLNTRIVANQEALLLNERLKNLLNIKSALKSPSLVASVIGEDSSPWFKTIIVDRGMDDGLGEGMPVITAAGVVGQLVNVAAHSSRVLILTDHGSSIAATVQRSRARGVVKGKGYGVCSLEFTLKEEDVKVGDSITTSGMGGIFPKGLPIGEITMVRKGEYGIFQTIDVRPAVNIQRLEEVLVLMKTNHD